MPDKFGCLLSPVTVDKGKATDVIDLDLCKAFDIALCVFLVAKLEKKKLI